MKKLLLPVFILFLSLSCSEDSLVIPSENNILKFKNIDEILAFMKNGNENGNFVSFDEIYHEAVDQLSNAETEAEHSELLNTYRDVVTLSEETYVPTLSHTAYRKIINSDRLYVSDGSAHKVINDQFIVFCDEKNINELKKITSEQHLDSKIFKVFKYQSVDSDLNQTDGRVAANCGASILAEYFYNQGRCRDDRRVYIRGYTSFIVSGNQYTAAVISEAWGQLRTGTWCNWKPYPTTLSTRNCSFTVTFRINDVDYVKPFAFADYYGTTDEYEHILIQGPYSIPFTWQGGYTPTIQFTNAHLGASSREVNGNWAILDCQ